MRRRKVTPIDRLPKSQTEGKKAQRELAAKLEQRGDGKVKALDYKTAFGNTTDALNDMADKIRKLSGVSGKASVSLFGLKVVVNPALDPMDMIMNKSNGVVYVGEDKWEVIRKAAEYTAGPTKSVYLGTEDFKEGSKSHGDT